MASTNSYRLRSEEKDLAGFVTTSNFNTGAMVCVAPKGDPTKPRLYSSDTDVIKYNGKPSSKYPDLFHAIDYVKTAPLFMITPVAPDARYGGVDVTTNSVIPFGIGRDFNTVDYTAIARPASHTIQALGDGITKTFTGVLTGSSSAVAAGTIKIYLAGRLLNIIDDSATTLAGTDLNGGTGSLVRATRAYTFTLAGTSGTPANLTTDIDLSGGVDLSTGAVDKFINIEIDGTLFSNINLGQSATTSQNDIVTAINTAVGSTVASISGNFIKLSGLIGSAQLGKVRVLAPTSGSSAMNLVFLTTGTSMTATNSTDPTGAIPKVGQSLICDYGYTEDMSLTTHFSIFMESPCSPETLSLAASVKHISDNKYTLTLYQNVLTGRQTLLSEVLFSLIREKSADGRSIFHEDVFENSQYIKLKVNNLYVGYSDPLSTSIVDLTGGFRGSEPDSVAIFEAWQNFKKKNLYPVKLFMDVRGEQANAVADLVANYQNKAFFITYTPMGGTPAEDVLYRQSLSIDTDGGALYTNRIKIKDPYNNTSVWITAVGKIGAKYAQMINKYDGLPPAGVDEAGLGGQLSGFQILEVENDYDEYLDLKTLDEAQINPVIKDQRYGVMAYGNRTLLSINTDTSFIHTRRLYNYIMKKTEDDVLKKQIFKLNDATHRLTAKTLTDAIVFPILNEGLLNDVYVQCDDFNNDSAVLDQRQFIVDVYVKATPDSEFVLLRVTRLSQGQVISELINK